MEWKWKKKSQQSDYKLQDYLFFLLLNRIHSILSQHNRSSMSSAMVTCKIDHEGYLIYDFNICTQGNQRGLARPTAAQSRLYLRHPLFHICYSSQPSHTTTTTTPIYNLILYFLLSNTITPLSKCKCNCQFVKISPTTFPCCTTAPPPIIDMATTTTSKKG